MKKVRIGMIGAGLHAQNMLYPSLSHLNEYHNRVAVCDLIEEKAREAAFNFGFEKVYTDYHEMIIKENLDGVIISINGKAHPSVVMECLKLGVDVLVEKPIAITVEEAMEIEKVVKDTRKIVMVEHMKRYSTAYKRAMDIVNSKDFGSIIMIESKMHGRPYVSLFNCLIEWQIHNIDIVRAFGGDVKNLKAIKRQIAENRAAIAVLLEFENGEVGTLNWGTEGGFGRYCERLEIVGSNWKGVIVENTRDVIYYDHNIGQVWRPDWQPVHDNFIHALDGYVGIIGKFIECINTRKQAGPTATDERKNLEIIHEIRKQLDIPFDWRYTPSEF